MMQTQKLLSFILCCFLFSFFLGQEVVQGQSARHHHHKTSHSPSKLFVFGDSYSDTGNTNKSQASWKYPYGITFPGKPAGRFSSGRVLTDFVAKFIGVRSPIPYRWRKYGIPLLRYGMNFAYGGTGVFVQTTLSIPKLLSVCSLCQSSLVRRPISQFCASRSILYIKQFVFSLQESLEFEVVLVTLMCVVISVAYFGLPFCGFCISF